jgi:hypothetical protein
LAFMAQQRVARWLSVLVLGGFIRHTHTMLQQQPCMSESCRNAAPCGDQASGFA